MAPKKEKLKEAESSLAATLAILNDKRAELKEVSTAPTIILTTATRT